MTNRVIGELQQNRLAVENIVINNVVQEADCEFHRLRKTMQEHYIEELKQTYGDKTLTLLYLAAHEIKGMERIAGVTKALFG
jgi:anion-transporting  ArsA/GET3 family ATPase